MPLAQSPRPLRCALAFALLLCVMLFGTPSFAGQGPGGRAMGERVRVGVGLGFWFDSATVGGSVGYVVNRYAVPYLSLTGEMGRDVGPRATALAGSTFYLGRGRKSLPYLDLAAGRRFVGSGSNAWLLNSGAGLLFFMGKRAGLSVGVVYQRQWLEDGGQAWDLFPTARIRVFL